MVPGVVGLVSVVPDSVPASPQGVSLLFWFLVRTKPSPRPRAMIQAMMRKVAIMIRRPCDISFDPILKKSNV